MLAKLEMNMSEFAELCGVTTAALRLWIGEGLPGWSKPARNSMYFDLRVALPWVIQHKWKRDQDDRARLRKIKADEAEADWLVKIGTLLESSKVREQWAEECAAMRARLLSIPAVAGMRIGPQHTQAQREEIIRSQIYEALTNLSGIPHEFPSLDPVLDPAPDPDPTPVKPKRTRKRP